MSDHEHDDRILISVPVFMLEFFFLVIVIVIVILIWVTQKKSDTTEIRLESNILEAHVRKPKVQGIRGNELVGIVTILLRLTVSEYGGIARRTYGSI